MTQATPKRILLGITGGIAAYKAAELTRLFVKAGIDVNVAMTEAATRFITPVTFQALSGHPVFTDQWDHRVDNNMAHIDLTRKADLVLIAPASADFLAKLSHGLANDLLSTLCLARDCPLMVAPAMNLQMWENPATQRNVAQLRSDDVHVLGPASGDQACGEVGDGRMLEPEILFDAVQVFFQPKSLAGKKIIVTAGPTFEPIDTVRGITNSSSGKMGYAVAKAAIEAGAEVTLISGPTSLTTPTGVKRIDVNSAAEMFSAVKQSLPGTEIFIGVAAVADYTPAQFSNTKIKKNDASLTIELTPTVDILAHVAALPNPPFCVGFAAESENLLEYAEAKRKKKNIPLIAANLVQNAMGFDENQLTLIDNAGRHPLPRGSKILQARALINHIAKLLANGPAKLAK
ncbi:MAG TPA: bifunctional phosphopantothenoylcysteine decarboxylase/phosphopantothenate--cysteine ligase CoaBC [Burkholderiales bacterium]|nr:bifunctional phosphopantothenoylcysteine decarboxylase/phosphopantothenate--cysteine ligase CoaBC [Burkholderiales bacterium]